MGLEMTIGKKIALRRKERKLTQAALAAATGVTTAFISQIESGHRKPSYSLMIRIAHHLLIPIENLIAREIKELEDSTDKLIISALPSLDSAKKEKVVDYLLSLTGSRPLPDIPLLSSAVEYAQYITERYKIGIPPIDVWPIASALQIPIFKTTLDGPDGILYKSDSPHIVLNNEQMFLKRQKFTLAYLLGHLIIPWHLRSTFTRSVNQRSLEYSDQLQIEASEFAGELLLPSSVIRKQLKGVEITIEYLERFAEMYDTSMTALAHKYIEHFGSKTVYLTSDNGTFTRVYQNGFPYTLVENVPAESFANSFITSPPSTKSVRKGIIRGSQWFKDFADEGTIEEESMLDPKFGVTVTLLKLK